MTTDDATSDDWLAAYENAYRDPLAIENLPCPGCGAHALHMQFVLYRPDQNRPTALFWCGRCMTGLMLGPAPAPAGVQPVLASDIDVPNYRILPPIG